MIGEFIIGGISQLKLTVAFCRVFWSVIVVVLLVLTCMCIRLRPIPEFTDTDTLDLQ